MSNIDDLLGFAIDKNPIDFATAFDNIVREKAATALENKRIELAQAIYGADGEDEDEDQVDNEVEGEEEEDFDIDDLDLDDLDLDLDDIDLNDEGTDEEA